MIFPIENNQAFLDVHVTDQNKFEEAMSRALCKEELNKFFSEYYGFEIAGVTFTEDKFKDHIENELRNKITLEFQKCLKNINILINEGRKTNGFKSFV